MGVGINEILNRRVLDVLTGLVVISVAVALAGLTWRIAGHAGTGAVTVPSGRTAPAAAVDIAPALALAPFGKSAVTDAGQPTSLPLELKGIIQSTTPSLSTAFIASGGQPAAPFHIGEAVSGGTIESILRDRVVLRNAGRLEYLAFPDPTRSTNQTGAPQPSSQTARVMPPPPPSTPAPPAPPPIDAAPTSGGMRIGANAPPGLQPGDVVQSVNGNPVADAASAQSALAQARQSGSAQVQILRDGKRVTLTVPTR